MLPLLPLVRQEPRGLPPRSATERGSGVQIPDSKFAFLVDADFVFPANFSATLTYGVSGQMLDSMRSEWNVSLNRTAMIVPAFERHADVAAPAASATACAPSVAAIQHESQCWMYGKYDVPLTKERLQHMVRADKTVSGFYIERVRPRHRLRCCPRCRPRRRRHRAVHAAVANALFVASSTTLRQARAEACRAVASVARLLQPASGARRQGAVLV